MPLFSRVSDIPIKYTILIWEIFPEIATNTPPKITYLCITENFVFENISTKKASGNKHTNKTSKIKNNHHIVLEIFHLKNLSDQPQIKHRKSNFGICILQKKAVFLILDIF